MPNEYVDFVSDEDFLKCVKMIYDEYKKIEEKLNEVTEYQDSKSLEDLADILEVIYRIGELKGVSKEELDKIRVKNNEHGGFERNFFRRYI